MDYPSQELASKVLGMYDLGLMPLKVGIVPTPKGGGCRALAHVIVLIA